jgi:succinate dehydrogenase / fumarate reductase, cytochrome b subunit
MVGTLTLYQTSIGKKAVMAVTGIIGYGYVLLHMYGNLKMFQGPEAMNTYAAHLRTLGEPILSYGMALWLIRIVLIVAVVAHVWSAIVLTRQDWGGRPEKYAGGRKRVDAGYAGLTLRWGGLILFFFLIFHIMHFTTGTANANFVEGNPYVNVVVGFQNPLAVAFYLLAVGCLAAHLYHGVWSAFQTLGLNSERTDRVWHGLAVLSAVVLFVGFASVPIAVLAGVLTLPA